MIYTSIYVQRTVCYSNRTIFSDVHFALGILTLHVVTELRMRNFIMLRKDTIGSQYIQTAI